MVMWSCFKLGIVVILIFISNVADGLRERVVTTSRINIDEDQGQCDAFEDGFPDSTSFMQSAGMHVGLNSLGDERAGDVTRRNVSSYPSQLLSLIGINSDAVARGATTLSSQARTVLQRHAVVSRNALSTILIMFMMLASLLFVICLCAIKRNRRPNDSIADPSRSVMGQWASLPRETSSKQNLASNAGMVSPLRSAAESLAPQENMWGSLSRVGSNLPGVRTPMWNVTGATTPTQTSVQPPGFEPFSLSPRILANLTPQVGNRVLPPPLCPTLVLPVCEARFGVRVQELIALARQPSQGELDIVGLSGNTLLRAVMRVDGSQRMLELSMPEANSAPRATVGPALLGARSLEIRALKGVFYGTLEMRNTGACYVVRDGVTVLIIDGSTDDLELSIKSSQGVELASVRVSTELFGGSDHVEVRVEPGVDTVLVLCVVLAVLLLSP